MARRASGGEACVGSVALISKRATERSVSTEGLTEWNATLGGFRGADYDTVRC